MTPVRLCNCPSTLQLPEKLNPPIVLIGASARSAAQSLARAEIACVTVDQFADQDTLQFAQESHRVQTNRKLAGRLASLSEHPIVCVGEWPGMIETIVNSTVRSLPCMSAWLAATQFDILKAAATKAGLGVPLTQTSLPSDTESKRFLEKRVHHSGGIGVRWSNHRLDHDRTDVLYQQWVAGRPLGATFLACRDHVQLLGVCRTLYGRFAELPFVYQGSFGPVDCVSESNRSRLLAAANAIASESGLLGLFNIDFIQSSDGTISLLEVNPRWSASSELIERSLTDLGVINSSKSLMGMSIKAMRGEHLKAFQQKIAPDRPPTQWIKRIIYAKSPKRFSYRQALKVADGIGSLHDIPFDGEPIESHSPCCTLVAKVNAADSSWWAKYRAAVRF